VNTKKLEITGSSVKQEKEGSKRKKRAEKRDESGIKRKLGREEGIDRTGRSLRRGVKYLRSNGKASSNQAPRNDWRTKAATY